MRYLKLLNNKYLRNKNKVEKIRKYNFSIKSIIKTLIKKINLYINNKNLDLSKNHLKILQSFLDRQSRKKIISKNKSSRLKSRFMKKVNNIF